MHPEIICTMPKYLLDGGGGCIQVVCDAVINGVFVYLDCQLLYFVEVIASYVILLLYNRCVNSKFY